MNPADILEAVCDWPVEERLALAFDLWDQIVDGTRGLQPNPEVKAELERRVAAHEGDPSRVLTWDQVVAHVKRRR
jgi:putative addiction module component (TIGR02574 family)